MSGCWSKTSWVISSVIFSIGAWIGLDWALNSVALQWLISATGINLKYDFLLNLTLSGHFMSLAKKSSIFSLTLNIPRESRCSPDSFLQEDNEVKNELMESDSSHAMTLWSLNTATHTNASSKLLLLTSLFSISILRQTSLMNKKPYQYTIYSEANPNECLNHLMGLLNNHLSVLRFNSTSLRHRENVIFPVCVWLRIQIQRIPPEFRLQSERKIWTYFVDPGTRFSSKKGSSYP